MKMPAHLPPELSSSWFLCFFLFCLDLCMCWGRVWQLEAVMSKKLSVFFPSSIFLLGWIHFHCTQITGVDTETFEVIIDWKGSAACNSWRLVELWQLSIKGVSVPVACVLACECMTWFQPPEVVWWVTSVCWGLPSLTGKREQAGREGLFLEWLNVHAACAYILSWAAFFLCGVGEVCPTGSLLFFFFFPHFSLNSRVGEGLDYTCLILL
jgi:hypothetical protein